ncbi:MAG: coenzyme F420-0:L-glutamate ligase [Candidatus Thorarchaeota archaeon]
MIEIIGLSGMGLLRPGDDIIEFIIEATSKNCFALQDDDILVIASKVVSKSEGRVVHRSMISVSERAREIATRNGFDEYQVQLALDESTRVLRDSGVLITERHDGLVCNFAGVDKSNVDKDEYVLLPVDPDQSAKRIADGLYDRTRCRVAVIVSDTQGRPWRRGIVNVAIGCSGIGVFKYNRGRRDLYDRTLEHSTVCQADEIAAAVGPVMGQADEGVPLAVVRGLRIEGDKGRASEIVRPRSQDMFR